MFCPSPGVQVAKKAKNSEVPGKREKSYLGKGATLAHEQRDVILPWMNFRRK